MTTSSDTSLANTSVVVRVIPDRKTACAITRANRTAEPLWVPNAERVIV